MDGTPTQRLASVLLGRPLSEYIAERRAAGKSWRLIAIDLRDDTDRQIDVTPEVLRRWTATAEHTRSGVPA